MTEDVSPIRALVRRARRRVRVQAAMEGAALGVIVASAAAVVVVFLVRTSTLTANLGVGLLAAAGSFVAAGAVLAAARRHSEEAIARRIDRASDLSDRLASALAFERERRAAPDRAAGLTGALMDAAVRDGLRAVSRARVAEAAPFHVPRDARAALGFAAIAAIVAGLVPRADEPARRVAPRTAVASIVPDAAAPRYDLDYPISVVDDLRRAAEREHARPVVELADTLDQALDRLDRGEIDKVGLLASLDLAERAEILAATRGSDELTGRLADVREAIRRLSPERPTIATAPPTAQPPPSPLPTSSPPSSPPPSSPPPTQPPPGAAPPGAPAPPPPATAQPPPPAQPPPGAPPPPAPTPPGDPLPPAICTGPGTGEPLAPLPGPPPPGGGGGELGDPDPDGPPGPGAVMDPPPAPQQWGEGPGPAPGAPTSAPRPAIARELHGAVGDGPSRRTTIEDAAHRGFASRPYRKVYADYTRVTEDVMRSEHVPSSYRYYIKRYFRAIRPSS